MMMRVIKLLDFILFFTNYFCFTCRQNRAGHIMKLSLVLLILPCILGQHNSIFQLP
jgi:hypothetical protein